MSFSSGLTHTLKLDWLVMSFLIPSKMFQYSYSDQIQYNTEVCLKLKIEFLMILILLNQLLQVMKHEI